MQSSLFQLLEPPKLRPYQHETVRKIYHHIREGKKRVLMVAPTGAGKTIMLCQIVKDALSKDRKVVIFVHLDVLVPQTLEALERFGLAPGAIKAGYPYLPAARVQVASVQSYSRRQIPFDFDLCIFDECHKVAWHKACQEILALHDVWYVGVSATPWRLKRTEGMGDVFDSLVVSTTPKKLMDTGYLSPGIYYCLEADLNLANVRTRNGDYRTDDLTKVCDVPDAIAETVSCWQERGQNRITIAFAVTVEHAEHLAQAFQAAGISANYVCGSTPKGERYELYAALRSGNLRVLVSVNVLSEGFDVPNVGCVILARPTKSKALHYQQVGRGLRIAEGKVDCIVLDRAGNCQRHGLPEHLTADHFGLAPGQEAGGGGEAPIKACPHCGAANHPSYRFCQECGKEFPIPENAIAVGEMVMFLTKTERKRLNLFRQWSALAYQRGFSPHYATGQYWAKYGEKPPQGFYLEAVFSGDNSVANILGFKAYLQGFVDSDEHPKFEERHMLMYLKSEFNSTNVQGIL